MRVERSIDIDAQQQRVWVVLADIATWPKRIETVESVELLTPPPVGIGTRMRIRQPKLPEGTYEVTAWDAPNSFEWRQQSGGMTIVAAHRVEALDEGRSRLTHTLEMRGLLVPIFGRMYRGLTERYMMLEAEGMKRAAESA